jgi:hypothetical protein
MLVAGLHIGVVVLVDGFPQVLPLLLQELGVQAALVVDPSFVFVPAWEFKKTFVSTAKGFIEDYL